jgi:hypothetical protein
VHARLRPQRFQLRSGEALLDIADRGLARLAVDVAEEPGAAAPRLIDDIDRIAVRDEVVGPAAPPVGRAEEVRCGLPPPWIITTG